MKKIIGKFALSVAASIFGMGSVTMNAQELHCQVEVNSSKIEGSSKSVFETLQQSINDYINETRFTNASFSPVERIECRFFLTVSEYNDDRIKGDLQVQLSRPVYNSTYTTTLLNFKDTKVEFDYREGDPLIYNENNTTNNLTAIIDYWIMMFLALDFDSFSPNGGQQFFDRAASIVQSMQSSGEIGWRQFEDTKNRAAVLSSFTDSNTGGIRNMMYNYHRKGLDEMVTSPDKGRAVITESLSEIEKVYKVSPMSVALSMFRDAKLDELVNVYSKAPETERKAVYDLLQPLYPTETERLEKIRQGQQN